MSGCPVPLCGLEVPEPDIEAVARVEPSGRVVWTMVGLLVRQPLAVHRETDA